MAQVIRDDRLVQIEAPVISFRGDDGTEYGRIANGVGSGLLNSGSVASPDAYTIVDNGAGTTTAYPHDAALSEYSGSSPALVFQSAIDAIKSAGGGISFKGTPTFKAADGGITSYPGIEIRGSGPLSSSPARASSIQIESGWSGPVITLEVNPDMPGQTFPSLRDFSIYDPYGQAASVGVLLQDTEAGSLLDAYLTRVLCFYVGEGFQQKSSAKLWMDGCYAEFCRGRGIYQTHGNLMARGCYLYGNGTYGVQVDATANRFNAIGSWFETNTYEGVYIANTVYEMGLNGCLFHNNGNTTTHAQQLVINALSNYGRVVGCDFGDDRGAGNNVVYHINAAFGGAVHAVITGNTFHGHSSTVAPVALDAQTANKVRMYSNVGLNDAVGKIDTPFTTTPSAIVGLEGHWGGTGKTAAPIASTAYVVDGTPLTVASSGGTGVSITIQDPGGNTLQSGLATFYGRLDPGYSINFGGFSAAPTVVIALC